ncbi:leaf rust 10 disease-resistance locus receptor-like protein kinase-like 1.2, partial [Fagus crenata]
MHPLLHSSSLLLFMIIGFVVGDEDTSITYPFRLDGQNPNCSGRGFELKCADNNTVVEIMSQQYLVLRLNPDKIITVIPKDIVDHDGCPHKLVNTTLNSTLFDYENLTFVYNCTNGVPPWVVSGSACKNGFYLEQRNSEDNEKIKQIRSCRSRVEIPAARSLHEEQNRDGLKAASKKGFDLIYKDDWGCIRSPHECEYNWTTMKFDCLCPNSKAKKIGAVDPNFQTCGVPQNCGDGQNIKFPFYIQEKQKLSCGYPGFNLSCNKNGQPIISISRSNYIIQKLFYQNQTIRVSNSAFSYSNSNCIPLISSISLPNGRFELAPHQTNLSLFYNCSSSLHESFPSQFYSACDGKNESSSVLALSKNDPKQLSYVSKECRSEVVAPVEAYRNGSDGIVEVLRIGFLLKWKASNCNICEGSGGLCGFEYGTFSPKCFCPDRPHALRCNT